MKNISILQGQHFVNKNANVTRRLVMDYELDFNVKGGRKIYIDGNSYTINKSSLFFKRPGQMVQSIGDYNCYIMTLDFTGREITSIYDRNAAKKMQAICHDEILDMIPCVFIPKHAQEIETLMERICLYSYPHSSHDPVVIKLVLEILYLIAADVLEQTNKDVIEQNVITNACEYMKYHFSECITLEILAKSANVSKEHFARLFKKEMGISPIDYLIQVRLDNAKEKLIRTNMSIQEIAYHCGYNTPSFFYSYFKKRTGYTPMEYRRIFSETAL